MLVADGANIGWGSVFEVEVAARQVGRISSASLSLRRSSEKLCGRGDVEEGRTRPVKVGEAGASSRRKCFRCMCTSQGFQDTG